MLVAQEDMVVDLDRVFVLLKSVAEDAASDRGDLICGLEKGVAWIIRETM